MPCQLCSFIKVFCETTSISLCFFQYHSMGRYFLQQHWHTLCKWRDNSFGIALYSSVQYNPWSDWVIRGHDRWFSTDFLPVFLAGGHCQPFWHGERCPVHTLQTETNTDITTAAEVTYLWLQNCAPQGPTCLLPHWCCHGSPPGFCTKHPAFWPVFPSTLCTALKPPSGFSPFWNNQTGSGNLPPFFCVSRKCSVYQLSSLAN